MCNSRPCAVCVTFTMTMPSSNNRTLTNGTCPFQTPSCIRRKTLGYIYKLIFELPTHQWIQPCNTHMQCFKTIMPSCGVHLSVRPSVNICANCFFSQANGWITTKLAHDGFQLDLHPGCAQGQGQGQSSRDTDTFVISQKSLLLAGKWLDGDETHTWWSPGWSASRVCAQVQGQRSRDGMSCSVIDGLVFWWTCVSWFLGNFLSPTVSKGNNWKPGLCKQS